MWNNYNAAEGRQSSDLCWMGVRGRRPDTDGERYDRIGEYRQGARISGTELLRSDARFGGFLCTT
jgi:hypothetical protein